MSNHTLSEATSALAAQAAKSAEDALHASQRVANDALDNLRGASRQVRISAQQASRHTVNYIQDEPVKAVLIAAASGAALMALISLMGRSRRRD